MNIQEVLTLKVKEVINSIYKVDLPEVEFQPTRKDFAGDITVVNRGADRPVFKGRC
jgi:arginyl-tRNA synthetase